MKKTCLFVMLLLTVTATSNSIAFGQPSSDKVLITREEQRNCIKWHSENLYKDSVIHTKDVIISLKDSVYLVQLSKNKEISDTLTALKVDYTKAQKKVKRNRRMAIGGISAFIASIILLFTIK